MRTNLTNKAKTPDEVTAERILDGWVKGYRWLGWAKENTIQAMLSYHEVKNEENTKALKEKLGVIEANRKNKWKRWWKI